MRVWKAAGVLLLGHASFAGIQLVLSIDDLRLSSEAFAGPESPYKVFLGFIGLNVLMIGSAGVLGGYVLRVQQPKLKYVLSLSLVTALYGGFGMAVGVGTLGVGIAQKVRSSGI